MTKREHVLNILKEVHKGQSRSDESAGQYLERMADLTLGYLEEDKSKKVARKEEDPKQ